MDETNSEKNTRRDFLAAGVAVGGALLAASQAGAQTPASGRVTAHVLDLYGGTPANGIKLDFYAYSGGMPALIKSVVTGADGRPSDGLLVLPSDMKTGRYRIDVHVGDYYKKVGAKLPGGYHTRLAMEFDIYDATQPHHLPFQITPWTQSSSVLPG